MLQENIQLYLQKQVAKVNEYIIEWLQTEDFQLQQLINYLLQQQGKQLRPQLVLASALALGGGITEKTLRGAALVSLVHNASLIHDDVVDEATHRRHVKTFNAVWDNKLAVLFGDYILTTILRIAVDNQDYEYLSMLARTAQTMSVGEIKQLMQVGQRMITEEDYLEVIRYKTASLFGAASALGALSMAAPAQHVQMMCMVGEQVGMAFQLRDDLLDYTKEEQDTGKAAFMDLKGGKLTLPLIYSLGQVSVSESQTILDMLYSPTFDTQKIVTFVKEAGGFEYTLQKILSYKNAVLDILNANLSPSLSKTFILLIEEMLKI